MTCMACLWYHSLVAFTSITNLLSVVVVELVMVFDRLIESVSMARGRSVIGMLVILWPNRHALSNALAKAYTSASITEGQIYLLLSDGEWSMLHLPDALQESTMRLSSNRRPGVLTINIQ